MMDPGRLEEGEATAFERQLLDAAKRQAPGAALKARMQEGLGLAGATVPVQVAVAKSVALGLGWKANVVLALLAVGAAVTVPLVWRNDPDTSSSRPEATTRAPLQGQQDLQDLQDQQGLQGPKDRPVARVAGAANTLTDEIRMLDGVRGAISARAPRRALAELQNYERRFPNGAFNPEATVLRIEALDAAGDHASARTLGRRFLAQHPRNPLADRVARIVQR